MIPKAPIVWLLKELIDDENQERHIGFDNARIQAAAVNAIHGAAEAAIIAEF